MTMVNNSPSPTLDTPHYDGPHDEDTTSFIWINTRQTNNSTGSRKASPRALPIRRPNNTTNLQTASS